MSNLAIARLKSTSEQAYEPMFEELFIDFVKRGEEA